MDHLFFRPLGFGAWPLLPGKKRLESETTDAGLLLSSRHKSGLTGLYKSDFDHLLFWPESVDQTHDGPLMHGQAADALSSIDVGT